MKVGYSQYCNLVACMKRVRDAHSADLPLDVPYLKQVYKPGDSIDISYTGRPDLEASAGGKAPDPKLQQEIDLAGHVFNGEYRIIVDKSQYKVTSLRKIKPSREGSAIAMGDLIQYALCKLDVEPGDGVICNTKTGRIERRTVHAGGDGPSADFRPIIRQFSRTYAYNTAMYDGVCKRMEGESALTTGYSIANLCTIALGLGLGYTVNIPPVYQTLVENGLRTIDSAGGDLAAIGNHDKATKKLGAIGLSVVPTAWVADYLVRGAGVNPVDPLYVPIAVMFNCVDTITQGIISAKRNGWKDPLFWGSILGATFGGLAALGYRLLMNQFVPLPAAAFAGLDAGAVLSFVDNSVMNLCVRAAKMKRWRDFEKSLCSDDQLQGYAQLMKDKGDYEFAVKGTGQFIPRTEYSLPSPALKRPSTAKYAKLVE